MVLFSFLHKGVLFMSIIVRNNSNSNSSGSGGGGGDNGYPPDSVDIIRSSAYNKTVVLQWSDPQDTILDAIVFAKWSGTLLVKKEGEAPLNEKDGEVLLDNKIRDQYKDTQFIDENVEYDKTYYYRFFPYSEEGVYSTDLKNVTLGITPKEIQPVFGDNTFEQIHYAIQQGIHDTLWNIGDTIKIYFDEITGLTITDEYGENPKTFLTPSGYIEFMIADFNKNTRYKDDSIKANTGTGEFGGNLWIKPYNYETNPQNIILVQKTACVNGEPTYFSNIGIGLSEWCYPGHQTYLDKFTSKCHLYLSDVPSEKVDEYFCDIDFYCYYDWDTSIDLDDYTKYFCRQKFFRLWDECINAFSSTGNIGGLKCFTDDSSRIYKDKNGNKKNYMLLRNVWSISVTDRHINTSGVFSSGFKSNESGRIFCALK